MNAEQEFEKHRRLLWGVCYRMTGLASDADDLVQETFVRALQKPPELREDGWRSWLMRTATNLSIDCLRRRKMRDYTGPWLPSPVEIEEEAAQPSYEVAAGYDLMESVSMAFLLAMERLSPRQRAVLLLRDVFDYSVEETAEALNMTTANVKVTHHRTRAAMEEYRQRRTMPAAERNAATQSKLAAFLMHLQNGDVSAVESMLATDVRVLSDGGGEFAAAMQPVIGRDHVLKLLMTTASKRSASMIRFCLVNGEPAMVAETDAPPGWARRFVMRIELDADGKIREVHSIFATAKVASIRFGVC